MKRIGTLFACILIAGVPLAQAGTHQSNPATDQATATHAEMRHAGADHDRMFADAMAAHHRDGVVMAKLAVDKAQSAELRAMAQAMIDVQTREIEQMQSLRGDGAPMDMSDMAMEMPGMMSEAEMRSDMERLEKATGDAFDVAFTEIMAKHHQGAITMATHELENGSSEPMKEIARNIVTQQTAERDRLLAMHRDLKDAPPAAMTSSATERQRLSKD